MSLRRLLLSAAASLLIVSPLLAGPAWLTIELPPNPFDPASADAFLLAHVFHHRSEVGEPVTGRAVGIVDGQRRTAALTLRRTSRPGVYALNRTWGDTGEWTLVLTASQDHGNAAEVMVRVSGTRVIGVEAATRPSRFSELRVEPRRFTDAEIEASLADRPGGAARPAP